VPILLALLFLALDGGEAARELARKISPRDSVAFSVRNQSSLGPAEVARIRRVLADELKPRGEPQAEVRVTISENLESYLLVAEIRRGEEKKIVMVPWKRATPTTGPPSVSIEKRFLLEQAEPVLDIAFPESGGMLILDSAKLGLFSTQKSVSLPISGPFPRDLRGRLQLQGDTFRAFLPGWMCAGTLSDLQPSCRPSDEPWPLDPAHQARLAPGRNYFQGRSPFYSVAWDVYAPLDRPAFPGWGSDVAAIESACGAGKQVVATRAGDQDSDSVQAFEIRDGQPVPVSLPVEFPGPVTALWQASSNAVVAVSRDPATGKYVAFRLSLVCGS
jgi:hypothetical protein